MCWYSTTHNFYTNGRCYVSCLFNKKKKCFYLFLFSMKQTLITSLGYIGAFEIVDDHRSGKIVIELNGRLNKCGVISPRFNIRLVDLEKWTANLLPARQFGYLILTTSAGIMDHEEARQKHVGGKILGFFY